ncbi:DUF6427 family protein [Flaviaesturariibacter amylovorans]|uniref:Beta-carotene 15,15'-monooxygenase n=1 Tax=Flaviaesturariibacter amylovorans TaxID=1084520 RepID=A0ABP8HCY4_9BACT
MLALFKQKAPGTIAILFITALLLKLPLFSNPALVRTATDGPLFRSLAAWLQAGSPLYAGILAFLAQFVGAVMINHVVNEYRMTTRQTFLPALSFLLITSLVPEWSLLSAPLLASLLLLGAFSLCLHLYAATKANGRIFNIGLLTGLAAFFYSPSLFFVALALICLMVLRPFRVNEVLMLLLGVLTPTYFYAVYLFLTDAFSWKALVPVLDFSVIDRRASYTLLASIVLLLTPFLLGSYYVQVNLRKMLIQARKNWSLLLFYLLLAFGMPFFNNAGQYTGWVLLAPPLAAFHACAYLYPPRRWSPLLLFFVILLYILALQYGIGMIKK